MVARAVIITLDGSPVMFLEREKNVHVVFNVLRMLCTFIFLCKKKFRVRIRVLDYLSGSLT